ncbi:MAG TPA: selenium cofactor biosynthesis protein YqeC [Anaerolineales bacterium]|jgi:molybdenum cofactor cytidylyltransferase
MTSLSQALRLKRHTYVAFVGAGGKTTAMFQAARELVPVLVSTSTHLGAWQARLADAHFTWKVGAPMPDLEHQACAGVTLITGELKAESQRYAGLSVTQLEDLRQFAAFHYLPLLIEADGARQKPLKAPGENEPVIPANVDLVVLLAGLSGLGQPLGTDSVHRPELFGKLSGLAPGEIIHPQTLAQVLTQPEGGLKNIPPQSRRVVLLNQADTPALQSEAKGLADRLLAVHDAVVVAALGKQPGGVMAIHEHIAGVILAGGGSSRFGQPKQLLDYHGKTFVRSVAETALRAGLEPLVLVSGSNAEAVSAAVAGLPLIIAHNPQWQAGQSTSLKTGLSRLPSNTGGAIFLLADQPQVSAELLRALVERHSQDLVPILAPYVFDQRANPLLFDQITFPDLQAVTGDMGGRAIFSKFSPRYLNWYDRRLLLDVDTPEDYRRLIDADNEA